jgi:hypothetical protein
MPGEEKSRVRLEQQQGVQGVMMTVINNNIRDTDMRHRYET